MFKPSKPIKTFLLFAVILIIGFSCAKKTSGPSTSVANSIDGVWVVYTDSTSVSATKIRIIFKSDGSYVQTHAQVNYSSFDNSSDGYYTYILTGTWVDSGSNVYINVSNCEASGSISNSLVTTDCDSIQVASEIDTILIDTVGNTWTININGKDLIFNKEFSRIVSPCNSTVTSQSTSNEVDYTVSGSEIIITYYDEQRIISYCSGSNLIVDTTGAGRFERDTVSYVVSGNTLKINIFELSNVFQDQSAIIQLVYVLTRMSGSGLLGKWKITNIEYFVLTGTLTAEEIAQWNGLIQQANQDASTNEVIWEITSTKIIFPDNNDNTINSYVETFIADFNGRYGSSSDIKVDSLNVWSVKLTGLKTGEIIILCWNEAGDLSYSSSILSNKRFTFYENPIACPQYGAPDWLYMFLWENKKNAGTLYKKATKQERFKRKLDLFFPFK